MITYANCRLAIRDGNAKAPMVVAWLPDKVAWVLSDPRCPVAGAEPDLLCIGLGHLPIPLSESGCTILQQLVRQFASAPPPNPNEVCLP